MRVFGLDFTSDPKPTKRLTLAVCDFDGKALVLKALRELDSPKKTPFVGFEQWLKEAGPWVAGLDFPFGMPAAAILHFKWLAKAAHRDWLSYLHTIEGKCHTRKDFKELIESWVDPQKRSKKDKPELIRHHRKTDNREGVKAQSPMNCVNPGLGKMFFEGCSRLAKADVSVEPVRRLPKADRIAFEAYPKFVTRRWLFSQQGYKSDKKEPPAKAQEQRYARCDVISAIRGKARNDCRRSMEDQFGFTVEMQDTDAQTCVYDEAGDKLDSVLCAIQAAWAWAKREDNYGIPADCDLLEGWIVDPFPATASDEEGDDEPC